MSYIIATRDDQGKILQYVRIELVDDVKEASTIGRFDTMTHVYMTLESVFPELNLIGLAYTATGEEPGEDE